MNNSVAGCSLRWLDESGLTWSRILSNNESLSFWATTGGGNG